MKPVNTQTVQTIITTLHEGMCHAHRATSARESVTSVLTDCHDSGEAALLVKAAMEQAILQGKADVVKNADGSRNDKASNWKRDLAKAYNAAYPDSATLSIKTAGKGAERTVTLAYTEKVEKSDREKFLARVKAICETVNATEVEAKSITSKLEKLYDFEQSRIETAKVEAKQHAASQLAEEAARVTARISEKLEAAGIAVTPENIEAARVFAVM